MKTQAIDSAVPGISVSIAATAPCGNATWRAVADLLADSTIPAAARAALQELAAGASVVEPVSKVAIDIKMLEAGLAAFRAHGDDAGATVAEIYKAMRAARAAAG